MTDEELEELAREAWEAAERAAPEMFATHRWCDLDIEHFKDAAHRLLSGRPDEEEIDEWIFPKSGRAFVDVVREHASRGGTSAPRVAGRHVSKVATHCVHCKQPLKYEGAAGMKCPTHGWDYK